MRKHGLYFAWVIALTGTLGSLFYGEFLGMVPCPLCWYQRIFLYPLAIILGIATYRNDRKISVYSIPLAFLGFVVALYQVLKSYIPDYFPSQLCGPLECSVKNYIIYGYISIPLLSLIAFLLITFLIFIACRWKEVE